MLIAVAKIASLNKHEVYLLFKEVEYLTRECVKSPEKRP